MNLYRLTSALEKFLCTETNHTRTSLTAWRIVVLVLLLGWFPSQPKTGSTSPIKKQRGWKPCQNDSHGPRRRDDLLKNWTFCCQSLHNQSAQASRVDGTSRTAPRVFLCTSHALGLCEFCTVQHTVLYSHRYLARWKVWHARAHGKSQRAKTKYLLYLVAGWKFQANNQMASLQRWFQHLHAPMSWKRISTCLKSVGCLLLPSQGHSRQLRLQKACAHQRVGPSKGTSHMTLGCSQCSTKPKSQCPKME